MEALEDLIRDLEKAVELAAQYSGGWSDHHFSAEEFHANLASKVDLLKSGDTRVLADLLIWFTPSYDWDDFIGEEGMPLANSIHSKLLMIKIPGHST